MKNYQVKTHFCYLVVVVIFISTLFSGCYKSSIEYPDDLRIYQNNVPATWVELLLYIVQNSQPNTPTYNSRNFGYIGLAMYEIARYSDSHYQSVLLNLNGFDQSALVQPPSGRINYNLAINASNSYLIKNFYIFSPEIIKVYIDILENKLSEKYAQNYSPAENELSIQFGLRVAQAIYNWSLNDGGDNAYNNVFNYVGYIFNSKPGALWNLDFVVQSGNIQGGGSSRTEPSGMMHAFWGNNRNFLIANKNLAIPSPLNFSDEKKSDLYREHDSLYNALLVLTNEQKNIVYWWGDDPTESPSPPGHSLAITKQILIEQETNLVTSCQILAMVGLAVGESFINAWKAKLYYFRERPSTYISRNHIASNEWSSYFPEPPFPSFYSGHSVQFASTVKILENFFGTNFAFTDNTYINRPLTEIEKQRNISFHARSYNVLWDIALEVASARFYGGIHIANDNKVGLEQGVLIAQNIINLPWKK